MAEQVHHTGRVLPVKTGYNLRSRFVMRGKGGEREARVAPYPLVPPLPPKGVGMVEHATALPMIPVPLPPEEPMKIPKHILNGEMLPILQKNIRKDRNNYHWNQVRTKRWETSICGSYQFRIPKKDSMYLQNLEHWIRLSFLHFARPCKLQVMVSYVLWNKETDTSRWFYSSENTTIVRPSDSRIIHDVREINRLLKQFSMQDIIRNLQMQNTEVDYKYHFDGFTSVTVRCNAVTNSLVRYGCEDVEIPTWMMTQKNMKHFIRKNGESNFSRAGLCAFRAIFYCLEQHKSLANLKGRQLDSAVEKGGIALAQRYRGEEYEGPIELAEISAIEQALQVQINLWTLSLSEKELEFSQVGDRKRATRTAKKTIARRARASEANEDWPVVHVCLVNHHISAIKDIESFANIYFCKKCDARFKIAHDLTRHHQNTNDNCDQRVIRPTNSIWYNVHPTLTEELKAWGINVPHDFDTFHIIGAYDVETYQKPRSELTGNKLVYSHDMRLITVSYAATLPGFEVQVHMEKDNWSKLVLDMVDFIERADRAAERVYLSKFSTLLEDIIKASVEAEARGAYDPYGGLYQRVKARFRQIPFYGFYSSKFDVPVVLPVWAEEMVNKRGKKVNMMKMGGKYMSLQWYRGQLLDFSNYLAPGTSLSKFIKTYDIEEGKLVWPHAKFTSTEFLDQTTFPPIEDFWNDLKECLTITQEEYNISKKFYVDNKLENMGQYLMEYNKRDVKPFLEAIVCHVKMFHEHLGIDILREGMTLSSIAHKLMMRNMSPWLPFALPRLPFRRQVTEQESKSLLDVQIYDVQRAHSMGGLAIVSNRMQLKGLTTVRKDSKYITDTVTGYDFNSLYAYAMSQGQFVLYPTFWSKCEYAYNRHDLKPSNLSLMEMEMVLFLSNTTEYRKQLTRSALTHAGQLRPLKDRNFAFDFAAVNSKTAFELDGCHYHYCDDTSCASRKIWDQKGPIMIAAQKEAQTDRKSQIINAGWVIHHVPSCKWEIWRRGIETANMGWFTGKSVEIRDFLQKYVELPYRDVPSLSLENLETYILDGSMEGMIFCELAPNDEITREKWIDYPPIFKKMSVTRDMLPGFTEKLCKKWNAFTKPCDQLVSLTETVGPQLFDSRFVRWLVTEENYHIHNLRYVLQYKCVPIFFDIIQKLVQLRRYGDSNPLWKCIAEIAKLLLNGAYGKMLEATDRRTANWILNAEQALSRIANILHVSCIPLEHTTELYEISNRKRVIAYDRPVQSAFSTLALSKLRMLQFMSWLHRCLDRDMYCLSISDTDSAYLGLAAPTIQECVRPDQRPYFESTYADWFVTDTFSSRTPGTRSILVCVN